MSYRVRQFTRLVHQGQLVVLRPGTTITRERAVELGLEGAVPTRVPGGMATVAAPGAPVWAGVASLPERTASLQRTVASLLPQVDRLGVYLDGHRQVPGWLDHPKVEVERRGSGGRLGDAGKFLWAGEAPGYYLACDDDLVYPRGYAAAMAAAVAHYHWQAVVGLHGRVYGGQPTAPGEYRSNYHCLAQVARSHVCHLLGTGAVAFHAPTLQLGMDTFPSPNLADVHFARRAALQGTPLVCLPHERGYLQHTDHPATIWSATAASTGGPLDSGRAQRQLLASTTWRLHPPARTRIVVVVLTYARAQQLRTLLAGLEHEAARYDATVEVRVYDDASPRYGGIAALCAAKGYAYHREPVRLGRTGHWQLVGRALGDLAQQPADWYVWLPDDCSLQPHFFARAVALWASLPEPTALNLAHHEGRPGACWTNAVPQVVAGGAAVEVGWVDGLYLCRRPALDALGYMLQEPGRDWQAPGRGSGVGAQVSRRLARLGARIYRPAQSLVTMGNGASRMHPAQRKRESQAAVSPVPALPEGVQLYPVRGPRHTATLACHAADHIGRTLATGAYYEADVLAAIHARQPRGLAVDVGAYCGTHAVYYATELGLDTVAIEANPAAYLLLRASCEASGCTGLVACWHAAVHDSWQQGATSVPGPSENMGMATVAPGGTTPVIRLDDYLYERPVGLLKVDVEGLAAPVLRSAEHTLARWQPLVAAEARDAAELAATAAVLEPLGYQRSATPYGRTPVWLWAAA